MSIQALEAGSTGQHADDYSGVQPWSKSGLYPYVIYVQETPKGLRYGVIGGRITQYTLIGTYDQAYSFALLCKQFDKEDRHDVHG